MTFLKSKVYARPGVRIEPEFGAPVLSESQRYSISKGQNRNSRFTFTTNARLRRSG
jgi:hypothetical protein